MDIVPNDFESDTTAGPELAADEMAKPPPVGPGAASEAMPVQGAVNAASMVNEPRSRKIAREIKSGFAREEWLRDLANTINKRGDQWVDDTIDLANLLKQAWDQFPDSRDGRTQWQKWVWDNIKLGESRVRELLSVAKATNPQQALMRLRLRNKERVAKHRENQKLAALRNGADPDPISVRQKLADWAMYADEATVQEVWDHASSKHQPKPRKMGEMEMHIYVREGKELNAGAIVRELRVDREEANRLLKYALDVRIIKLSQTGRLIKKHHAWGPERLLKFEELFGPKAAAILDRHYLGWDIYYLKPEQFRQEIFDKIWGLLCSGCDMTDAVERTKCEPLEGIPIMLEHYEEQSYRGDFKDSELNPFAGDPVFPDDGRPPPEGDSPF